MPLDWGHDEREDHVDRYLGDSVKGIEYRLKTFTDEWKTELKRIRGDPSVKPSRSATQFVNVTWQALAQECARIFRDIPIEQQKTLFYMLLEQYVRSPRVAHWTDEQRRQVLQRAAEA